MVRRLTVFALLAAMILLTAPATMAAGCANLVRTDQIQIWVDFPASNHLSGWVTIYQTSACDTPHFFRIDAEVPGMVYASSLQSAMSLCQEHSSKTISTVSQKSADRNIWDCHVFDLPGEVDRTDRFNGWVDAPDAATALSFCNRGYVHHPTNYVRKSGSHRWMCFYIRGGSGASSGSGGSSGASRINVCDFHINLPLNDLRLHAFDGMDSGIQFRRLDNCGIGDPAVFEMGFLDAVDIWSSVGSGYSVCFPQLGRIVFLDAATSPRTLMDVDYVFDDGFTCAAMDRAGTMALVEAGDTGAETTPGPTRPTRRPGTDDSMDDAIDLKECTVTPRFNLRLRAAPWGKIRHIIPHGTEVQARARTQNWFSVSYEETDGWSAEWLADSEGECDWTNSDIEGEDE